MLLYFTSYFRVWRGWRLAAIICLVATLYKLFGEKKHHAPSEQDYIKKTIHDFVLCFLKK